MNKKTTGSILLVFFAFALFADLAAIVADLPRIRYFSKPLLMPLLAVWYFMQPKAAHRPLNSLVPAALFFSWLGDLFLLFEDQFPVFFIVGLSSFLIAHIFYLIYFSRISMHRSAWFRLTRIIPIIAYYFLFIGLLNPFLGALAWPVRFYGLAICLMLFTAAGLPRGSISLPGWKMLAGALLFVLSDSMLAINKFYRPIELAGAVIMLTYGLAQLLIVTGAARQQEMGDTGGLYVVRSESNR